MGDTHKAGCTQEKVFVIWKSIKRFDQQQNAESVAGHLNKEETALSVCVKQIQGVL